MSISCGKGQKEIGKSDAIAEAISIEEQQEPILLTDTEKGKTEGQILYYDAPDLESMVGTVGVVRLKVENDEQLSEKIYFYNDDKTTWATIDLSDGNGNYIYSGEQDFVVRLAKLDYPKLYMTCVSATDSTYTIIVNEETKESKILPKRDIFVLELWDEHIKHTFPYFENEYAKMYDAPNSATEIEYDREEPAIDVLEVQGNWILIEVADITGWIKWQDGDTLLAKLFYMI